MLRLLATDCMYIHLSDDTYVSTKIFSQTNSEYILLHTRERHRFDRYFSKTVLIICASVVLCCTNCFFIWLSVFLQSFFELFHHILLIILVLLSTILKVRLLHYQYYRIIRIITCYSA